MINISEFDIQALALIRKNIKNLLSNAAKLYDREDILVLDIAPQIYEGAREFFLKSKIETLDIDPDSSATYICSICDYNPIIEKEKFDLIVCTDVLEHVINPFDAIDEIHRILKPGGILLLSSPLNFRIHGPLPDCWRFTEHGWKQLVKKFEILEIDSIKTEDRDLMPIHYTLIVKK